MGVIESSQAHPGNDPAPLGKDDYYLGDLKVGPMTRRAGRLLAVMYDYVGLSHMSRDLPQDAEILDVGAGLSDLGYKMASARPDITWINLDLRYGATPVDQSSEEAIETLREQAPPNLSYVGGDILNPPQDYRGRFAHVFSYRVLRHIADNGLDFGILAARNMLEMAEPGGKLSVGPTTTTDRSVTSTVIAPKTPSSTEELATRLAHEALADRTTDRHKKHSLINIL